MRTLMNLVIITLLLCLVSSKRLRERIYVPVESASFCFRRTNGTHQFGCTSELSGNVGVVHVISDSADVDWIVDQGQHHPYIAAFEPRTFTKQNLKKLKESGKISGAILLDASGDPSSDSPPRRYSDDRACPNPSSSLYEENESCSDSNPWNEPGSGNAFEDFPFPIFITKNETTAKFIREDCFKTFNQPQEGVNRDWPLCAMELKSHMYAAVDSKTCLRRSSIVNVVNPTKFCDEMGDFNFFLFLNDRNQSKAEDPGSVIVVTTRLDTITMFDKNEFGGDSPITSIVTILETARLLAKEKPDFGSKVKNILFAFMYGEAFDYIGSSRFVYDLEEKSFPDAIDAEKFENGQQTVLELNDIDFVLELGQTFNKESGKKMFVHTDDNNLNSFLASRLMKYAGENKVDMKQSSRKDLPPSSLQSFLKSDRKMSGLFVSDFDQSFSNPYYHSLYDTGANNLNYNYELGENQDIVEHIANMALVLAEFLYEASSSEPVRIPSFTTNKTLINELLHCYLDTAHCSLFLAASNAFTPPFYTVIPDTPLPQYVGVDMKSQFHGIMTRNVLAYLTAEKVQINSEFEPGNMTQAECVTPENQNFYEYIFLKGESVPKWWNSNDLLCNQTSECGYCYKTLSFRRPAISPAFVIEDYDMANGTYSSWAESVWKTSSARIFLKASPAMEHGFFAAGLIVLILSGLLVFWFERKSGLIFDLESTPNSAGGTTNSTGTTSRDSREELQQRPTHL